MKKKLLDFQKSYKLIKGKNSFVKELDDLVCDAIIILIPFLVIFTEKRW